MENNTLVIERVKKDDEGLYECKASNDMGQDSTSAFIKIQGEVQAKAKCRCGVGLRRTRVQSWTLAAFKMSLYVEPTGSEEKSNIEVIILVCTGLAATLFWLLLTLFIRKLRKVRASNCTKGLGWGRVYV